MFIFIFFFQAEDGIRDGTVTGVQTCALPIYREQLPDQLQLGRIGRPQPGDLVGEGPERVVASRRSEERRVGKECRSRGAAYDEKKKTGMMGESQCDRKRVG